MTTDHSAFARDPLRRIEELERFVSNHGTSISAMVENHAALSRRVEHLEALAQARAITEAREDERDKALYDRLDRMDDEIKGTRGEVKDIRSIAAKAIWVFISAFIVAGATFVIKGGLS